MDKSSTILTVLVILFISWVVGVGLFVSRNVQTPEELPWDYGTVPFVPAKSHYSNLPLPDGIILPNPEATKVPPRSGGSR